MAPFKERRSLLDRESRSLLDSTLPSFTERDGKKQGRGGNGGNGGDGDGGNGGNGGGNGGNGGNGGKNKSDDNDNKKNNGDGNGNGNSNGGGGTTTIVTTSSVESIVTLPPLGAGVTEASPTLSTPSTTTTPTTTPTPIVTTTSIADTTTLISTVTASATPTTTLVLLTTSSPSQTDTSNPRKGVEPGTTVASPQFESASIATVAVSATGSAAGAAGTAFAETSGDRSGNLEGNGNLLPPDNGGGPLPPAAEKALISVGSIGGFILVSFVVWFVYRTFKRSKYNQGSNFGSSGFFNLPWRRNNNEGMWDNRSVIMANELAPPSYEAGNFNAMEKAGFYGPEKKFQPQPGGLTRSNTSSSQNSLLPRSLAPGSVVMVPAEQYMAMQAQAQLAAGSEASSTMRSRMADPFFNQSELARQPSDAYDPSQRQVNRISELSSLSSGFGDGDIVISELLSAPEPVADPRQSRRESAANGFLGRFSWMSRRDNSQRDTVYTNTSEDRPAKYRSVNSWVNQQTGRLKRADERRQGEEAAAPPVPDLPSSFQTSR
ncbi:hypothetical protein BX600DRAFT_515812 [Xylariales sp. PMI_506]|nr:hypothetical protein BX600DRAFT_515812 [Xylariales sp. PMI_506]